MPIPVYKAKSLCELIAIRATEQTNQPAVYTGIEGFELQSLTYGQIQKAVDRLAWHYAAQGLGAKPALGELPPQRVIAVFVTSAIDQSLLEIALTKLGLASLLVSVNNSPAAVAHLCKLTNAAHMIYSEKFSAESHEAQGILKTEGYDLALVPDRRFPLWDVGGIDSVEVEPFPAALTPEEEAGRTAVVLHSSGSTGFPKPCFITHYGLIANFAINQNKPGFSTLPLYHGFGHFALYRCIYAAQPFTLFPPHLPLTSSNICAILAASPPVTQCYAVPYVIKLLAETAEGLAALRSFDIVGFAGAAVPDDLGDRLVAAGVSLLSVYGTTETGGLLDSERDMATDKEWNWLRARGLALEYVVMEPRGDDTYEPVVRDGYPPKIQSNRPDGSYATKDLFKKHPTKENCWKYVGRLDDTLVHVVGEKTNPVPIELAIRGNSPLVQEAIVFGAGRPQTGCLILPSDQAKGLSNAEILEQIWPVIEQANAQAPTHSRLLPEMVEILPFDTVVPVATKLSILRPACYAKFKDVIADAIYNRFENEGKTRDKLRLDHQQLEVFILDTVTKTLGPAKSANLGRSVDLFAFGVDSLQGTRIRNVLQKELFLGGNTLGQNVVYEYPSVEKLANHILALQQTGPLPADEAKNEEQMIAMVEKWMAMLEAPFTRPVTFKRPVSRTIVLTGATGSLGAHILHQLLASSAVRKVICLSRARSHDESRTRVLDSLKTRRLAVPEDDGRVEFYAANPNVSLLGMTPTEYDSIRSEVTDVVHNAWPVNFALSLESFDEHVGGAINLLNLCLSTPGLAPAKFFFSPSISSRQGGPEDVCPEDFASSPSTAAGTGYARSKWVVEKICQRAAAEKGVSTGVLRIGQMVGDSVNGVWNETEAWPLMLKGAQTIGALPTINEYPSWLPTDHAAKAIADIVLLPEVSTTASLYHIVNPNTRTSWDDLLDMLRQSGLAFETVDPAMWLERLTSSEPDATKNPVIKLLPFFQMRYGGAIREPMVFSTEKTILSAPSLRAAPPITLDGVKTWMERWKETGFIV
ncbi:L-aminoadipate-semialdehyde dehydrogenase [Mycena chlorophos]|uniref:L-aminoadipate-semialdehyde dehydrogenase n=1 Tax=Mycena chlorophos TaxID=658473 RepID=A0A8H6S6Y1_MYCCL|nr:L-aminoadipate-semialdehyde dehydrogenase [Mycena chlorophos]